MTRNIDIGAVVSKVFRLYGDYAAVLLPVAAIVFVIEAAFQAAAIDSVGLLFLASLISLILGTLYQGMVVELVADVQDGRLDQSVGSLLGSVSAVFVPLLAVSVLAGIGRAIGFVLLIIPGLWLTTIWAVVAPVVVLEKPGIMRSFGRSQELVRGNGWQVFGVIVLFFVIFVVFGGALGAIGAALGDGGRVVLNFVGEVLAAPLVALAASVLYFELRSVRADGGLGRGGSAVPGPPAPGDAPERP